MRILLSNDDGYQSKGLMALAEVLSEIADIVIVAPDRDRSGASNSLTLDRPLRAIQFSETKLLSSLGRILNSAVISVVLYVKPFSSPSSQYFLHIVIIVLSSLRNLSSI